MVFSSFLLPKVLSFVFYAVFSLHLVLDEPCENFFDLLVNTQFHTFAQICTSSQYDLALDPSVWYLVLYGFIPAISCFAFCFCVTIQPFLHISKASEQLIDYILLSPVLALELGSHLISLKDFGSILHSLVALFTVIKKLDMWVERTNLKG